MKLKIFLLVVIFVQFLSNYSNAQKNNSILLNKLNQLGDLNLLPHYLEDDTYIGMVSTYDRKGKNDDGFKGTYSYIRKEGERRFVIAELEGPGIVERFWSPTLLLNDTLEFYFDNEEKPRVKMRALDIFNKNIFPFSEPLVGNELGGFFSYVPMPYKEHLKIVQITDMPRFHHIQYRSYPKGKKIDSFTLDWGDDEKKAFNKLSKMMVAKDPGMPACSENVKVIEKLVNISPGESVSLASILDGGRILRMEFDNADQLEGKNTDLILRTRWDDEDNYAINAPIATLFGYAFGKSSMSSMIIGTENKINYWNLPMPFDKKAELDLHYLNRKDREQSSKQFNVKIYYTDKERNKNQEGKLYTSWRRQEPKLGEPYQILKHEGKGHYVGTILICQGIKEELNGEFPTFFFEGDEVLAIDGVERKHGTGSEDYFNGGWYAVADRWDKQYSLPIHGCLEYSIPLARTGGYRWLITDKEPFNESYKLTIEHGAIDNNWEVDYSSIAFYYGEKPSKENMEPTIELTGPLVPPKKMKILPTVLFSVKSLGFPFDDFDLKRRTINGKRVYIMHSSTASGYVSTDLNVKVEGTYELYVSYFKSPESGTLQIYQRQKPISQEVNIKSESSSYEYVEKQFFGKIHVTKEESPLSFHIKGEKGKCDFVLESIDLIEISSDQPIDRH
jgi:hypothetical protein